ncbi:pentatricopeptide repeat-containing protein At1g08070, chloroplastic [Amborella trichopoda]|uniref:pentatricopeptide repeat-containing protein At1g08070, chloroplastic n=1 Tax=Amborella trichopoda TaxID=13333 RepID=UPI0005D41990|nr:pentatricopeptide repeat-containing protein At1g08070, chloroplastic [Amborella trichopoda]|eukprot:XP_011621937.1 pentatricopeptide repeat-containing protein At1g08070, chloroplastic [Amborella trichopoda]
MGTKLPPQCHNSSPISICQSTRELHAYSLKQFHGYHPPKQLSWSTLIVGYANSTAPREAILLFHHMLCVNNSFLPDNFTFPALLKACCDSDNSSAIEEGKQIHCQALKRGFCSDVFVQKRLIRFYAKFGALEDAWKVSGQCIGAIDTVCWNDMINGYIKIGRLDVAQHLFDDMVNKNAVSWSLMINGHANNGDMETAKLLFDEMPDTERSAFAWNSMIAGYAKNGRMVESQELLNQIPHRDVFSWTAVISGYSQNCLFKEALEAFHAMQVEKLEPNEITLISVLPAIAHFGATSQGRWIHAYIEKKKMAIDGVLGSALVDMYAKCGDIEEALRVFERLPCKELSAWNALISGFARHGLSKAALWFFSRMHGSNVKPNEITFVGVLSACSHGGLVDEGQMYFALMNDAYNITPNAKHYGCMVDLLGRSGHLNQAKELIESMHIKPNAVIWKTFLSACRIHDNVELAQQVAREAPEFDSEDSGPYILLSNIYAASGLWDEASKTRRTMKDMKVHKVPGCSWVEMDGIIHEFFAGDRSHPDSEAIYNKLDEMRLSLRTTGYVPNTSQILMDASEEEKRISVWHHSEKLAIAFGLIKGSSKNPFHVIKNLRICDDCHSVAKIISKIYRRKIVVRDQRRFHHFKDGMCSCMDYW